MTLKIAINGFGRIGRLVLRAIAEQKRQDLKVVAINDLADVETNAYLLRYDSVHGTAPFQVVTTDTTIDVGLGPIQVIAESNPEKLPWRELGIDLVMECSGRFTSREKASKHLTAGAKRVLISAPADQVDHTVVFGVNHQTLTSNHIVVSNASCTTNCLAPVAYILHKNFGIKHGYMTTIHAYTGDQRLVDTFHSDPRRARSAALSMIPTSTGAARAVGLVLPELKGKLDGTAIRVPTPNVSLIDFKFVSQTPTNAKEINVAIEKAASHELAGVLGTVHEPLVSSDFNHNPLSSVFDLSQTQVIEENFCRVLSWYDNEWGFSNRMVDTALTMGHLI
jgi:glyceraldehyde 3-phosphate dehydrogenase